MNTWNYRVMEFAADGDRWRAIHEVHYDSDGKPVLYSERPAVVLANDLDEFDLSRVLDRMREALTKPVLTEADFKVARIRAE